MPLNPANDKIFNLLCEKLPRDIFRNLDLKYLEEPRGMFVGRGGILALPQNTKQVSLIVKIAAQNSIGIVPYGGGSGLVGGQVSPAKIPYIILSLERMSAIKEIYPSENIIIVEAGAILAEVQEAAKKVDRIFPLSLASEGTARIGGNLATNAGGVNVLRYGSVRNLCLGLEAVLPDGSVFNGLNRLYKDNTGYDLRNLLIGSEGTLGIITAASLKLSPKPSSNATALLAIKEPKVALRVLAIARSEVAEGISALELMHRYGLEFLKKKIPSIRQPFKVFPEWLMLVDIGTGEGQSAEMALEKITAKAFSDGLVEDAWIAQSEAQRSDFWAIRENIPEANRLIGSISSNDISLPLSEIPKFIDLAKMEIKKIGDFRINCFGHIGDGNLHYNIFPPLGANKNNYLNKSSYIKRKVNDLVHSLGGSFSAEHGIGRLNVSELESYGDRAK